MKREVLRIVLIFVLCFVLAVGACLLCACIMDRVEPLASAEENDREVLREEESVQLRSDPVRSINTTLPDNGVVGDNILPVSDFSVSNDVWHYNSVSSISFNPLNLVASANYAGYAYYFSDPSFFVGNQFTLSIYARVITGEGALSARYTVPGQSGPTLTLGLVKFYNSDWAVISTSIDTTSFSSFNLFRFVIYANTAGTEIEVQWAKMELGSSFTGYVFNNYLNYGYDQGVVDGFEQGYTAGGQAGYDQGFLDGSHAYARSTHTLIFNDVESQNSLPFGWSDFGISDSYELQSTYFSMESYWFSEKGYVILDSGTFYTGPAGQGVITGVVIYISTAPDLLSYDDIFSVDFPWIGVSLSQYSSSLLIHDSSFPSNWNPVQYPRAKEVTITAQLGLSEWLDKVSTSSESIGYKTGYTAGYDAGLGVGYNNGYSYAIHINESGDWRSMISALIGVPVSYIRSFFDFQILGFNMLGLFQTLVTLSLFFFLLRFMMGKVSV